MEHINEDDLENSEPIPEKIENDVLSDKDFNTLLEELENPVTAQKHIAVKVKHFLDNRIDKEMREKGVLSDHTRRWVESYNNLLEKIQKALYGEKSVNLHIHKVTHSQIASRMRQYQD